ncbi:scavenger receptor cysteine-rich domain superfamily protein-like [Gigantopelta aegis]|uniref:scavenger receptor cysteine-rich domain superfamily protein-like n=1 Tax=Gigantopelta aegis TaxID=1735272 RepID=UPI001B88CD26|nr:scavenger receptor cysteine-rich domain superfamily protein-like [Gigantopelta aegis]
MCLRFRLRIRSKLRDCDSIKRFLVMVVLLHVSVTKHVIPLVIVAQISMTLAVSIKKALVLRPILLVVVRDLFHPVMEQEIRHLLIKVILYVLWVGSTSMEGRVEIQHNGQWGTVCDDHWNDRDATVVCEQLGSRDHKVLVLKEVNLGLGHLVYRYGWMKLTVLDMNNFLSDCPFNGWGNHDCSHFEDAGVICQGIAIVTVIFNNWSFWWSSSYPTCRGSTSHEGRVEIFLQNEWGTICDDDWSSIDAEVVCRQLGLPATGRVEIEYNGVWGTICDDYWGINDATVVCKQLGFRGATRASTNAEFGAASSVNGSNPSEGRVEIFYNNTWGTINITQCSFIGFGQHNCLHSEDAGVRCYGDYQKIRLVNGNSPSEGRVEVYYNSTWGSICDDHWDLQDAMVVCHMLDMSEPLMLLVGILLLEMLQHVGRKRRGYYGPVSIRVDDEHIQLMLKDDNEEEEERKMTFLRLA